MFLPLQILFGTLHLYGISLFYLTLLEDADDDMLDRPFMTTHEIAELLRVREQTVRAWIHQEELRAVKLGREFRVAVNDLEVFLNEHATCEPTVSAKGAASLK